MNSNSTDHEKKSLPNGPTKDSVSRTTAESSKLLPIIAALAAFPGNELLVRLLCRQVFHGVRLGLTYLVQVTRPWYGDLQTEKILATAFEILFDRVLRDVEAGGLDFEIMADADGALGLLAEQAFMTSLSNAGDRQSGPAPIAQFSTAKYSEGLVEAMAQMDEDSRYLVHLRLCLQLSFANMSEILRIPQDEIQARFRKAVDLLRTILGD